MIRWGGGKNEGKEGERERKNTVKDVCIHIS